MKKKVLNKLQHSSTENFPVLTENFPETTSRPRRKAITPLQPIGEDSILEPLPVNRVDYDPEALSEEERMMLMSKKGMFLTISLQRRINYRNSILPIAILDILAILLLPDF